ncbi:Mediator of DNA damage checkpoint protein 1, variant 2 [Basidiobolus ranarum]
MNLPGQQSSTVNNSFKFLQPSDEENSEEDSIRLSYLTKPDTVPMEIEAHTVATIPMSDSEFLKHDEIEPTLPLNDEPDASDTTIDYEEEGHQTAPTQPMSRQETLPSVIPFENDKNSIESMIRNTASRGKKPPPRIQDSDDDDGTDTTSESFPSLDKILGDLEPNPPTMNTTQESNINSSPAENISSKSTENSPKLLKSSPVGHRQDKRNSTDRSKAPARRNPARAKRLIIQEDSSTDDSDLEPMQESKSVERVSPINHMNPIENEKLSPVVSLTRRKPKKTNTDTDHEELKEVSLPSVTGGNKRSKRGKEDAKEMTSKKPRNSGKERIKVDLSVPLELAESSEIAEKCAPSPDKIPSKRNAKNRASSKNEALKTKDARSRGKRDNQVDSPDLKKELTIVVEQPVKAAETSSLNTSASNLDSSFEDENGSRKYPGRSKRKSMYAGLGSLLPCSISKPRVVFTGFTDPSKAKCVEQLGGTMEESWKNATHIVATNIKRTSKFLCGLCSGKPIVSPEWVDRSLIEKHFIDETDFELIDTNAEKQYDFRLSESLMRARHFPLMKGIKVFTTKKVNAGIREIAEVAGAELVSVLPSSPSTTKPPDFIVIGTEQDAKECTQISKEGFPVYLTEFVSIGALRQELDFENHQFVMSKRRTSSRRRS